MGYYTKFRFIGIVKDEYYKFLERLYADYLKDDDMIFWDAFAERYPFAKRFSELPRCGALAFSSIPFRNDETIFKKTENPFELKKAEAGWCGEINILEINTEFKNYNQEIECFMADIAPNICEHVCLAVYQDEEMEYPEMITGGKE